jgi:hypothetical protein
VLLRIGGACGLAMAMHWLGVDVLGGSLLTNMCPERATFALVALAGVVLALLLRRLWATGRLSARMLAAPPFLGLMLQVPVNILLIVLAPAVLGLAAHDYQWQPKTGRIAGATCLIAMIIAFIAIPTRHKTMSEKLTAAFTTIGAPRILGNLSPPRSMFKGVSDIAGCGTQSLDDTREMQVWIRDHTPVEAVLSPPPGHTHGWQVFSERACIMRPSFASYSSFSRELALRFDEFMKRYP